MTCPKCQRNSEVKMKVPTGKDKLLLSLSCGHSFVSDNNDPLGIESFVGVKNGFKLYPYQEYSINFGFKAGARVLFNLDMGLGKTPISFIMVQKMKLGKTLVVTKAGLKIQMLRESLGWIGELCQIITSPKDRLLNLNFFIISVDMIRKFSDDEIAALPFDCIIIDECQSIKNVDSQRSHAVRRICKDRKHIIALSATPIKNRFDEYFPILTILRPDLFPSYKKFVDNWCHFYWRGNTQKIGGCSRPEEFKELTKDFILRFTREEVLPDLPKIRRDFRYYDLEDAVRKAYNKVLDEFQEFYAGDKKAPGFLANLLAFFAKMRHITGVAKIKPTVEFIEDFLLSYDNGEKITIFVQHQLVGAQIFDYLKKLCSDAGYDSPAMYTSDLDVFQRAEVIEKFRGPNCRVLIASTQAAGEGLNLQFCSHCVFVERQWNPANEEQAEGRFPRPGNESSHIECTYMIALGTIDEFLTEIVEHKRNIVKSALDGTVCEYDESEILEELAIRLAASGKKGWSYK